LPFRLSKVHKDTFLIFSGMIGFSRIIRYSYISEEQPGNALQPRRHILKRRGEVKEKKGPEILAGNLRALILKQRRRRSS